MRERVCLAHASCVLGFGVSPKQCALDVVFAGKERAPIKVRDREDTLANRFATANPSCGGGDTFATLPLQFHLASDDESFYELQI